MPKTSNSHNLKFAIQLVVVVAFLAMAHGARASSISCAPNSAPSPATESDQSMTVSIQSIVVDGTKSDSATSEHVELLRAGSSSPEATVTVGTKLGKGDRICTKDDDQVVLEISFSGTENDDLIFLDPNTEVEIGSVCANQGRVLAWITTLTGLCHRFGTLARKGTEFEVENKLTGELDVVVYEGEVTFQPLGTQANLDYARNKTEAKVGGGLVPEITTITAQTKITITATGPEQVEVLPIAELGNKVDRWSQQIVKTNQYRVPIEKGFVQNIDPETRAKTFVQARHAALVNKSEQGYLDMAQALNDWNNGPAAQKSLARVKDESVRSSREFMVNEAAAEYLQGNVRAANANLDKTLNKYPDFAPANSLKGQILLESVNQAGAPNLKANEEAKEYLSRALKNESGKNLVNTKVVEAQLDQTITTQAIESLRKDPWASGQRLFTTDTSDWVSYSGTTSLNIGGKRVSGKAVLSIYGDQFKLKTANRIFTGRIVGNKHAGGISLALDFDDVDVTDQTNENVVISVSGKKFADRIVLQSATNQAESFAFKSQTGRIR